MSEDVWSMLLAPAALLLLLAIALVLTCTRPTSHVDVSARTKLVEVFLIGIAVQCTHFVEEFVTGVAFGLMVVYLIIKAVRAGPRQLSEVGPEDNCEGARHQVRSRGRPVGGGNPPGFRGTRAPSQHARPPVHGTPGW